MIVCPLYAGLPPAMQLAAFESPPPGTRKIILATNIAETSVTINGIKFFLSSFIILFLSFLFNTKIWINK